MSYLLIIITKKGLNLTKNLLLLDLKDTVKAIMAAEVLQKLLKIHSQYIQSFLRNNTAKQASKNLKFL